MNKMVAIILQFLGISEFSKENGKSTLTKEQRSKVEATFGKEFGDKFEAYLKDDAQTNENSETEAVAGLITALTNAQNSNTQKLEANFNKQLEAAKTASDAQIKVLTDQVDTLANRPEEEPIPDMDTNIPRAADKPVIMKVDMRKPHYEAVGHFLKSGSMAAVEAATIDVADLSNEFGTYLSQSRNNLDEVRAIFQGFTSAELFTSKMAITEWRATQALITSISQQFTPKWTPSGKARFRPLTIRNRRHKINYPVVPAEVLESYIMYMYDEGLAPDQMPITKYIWNQLVYPQLMQDIEVRMMWKGKYVEKNWGDVNTGDAGDAPENSMDGVETILVDGKSSGQTGIRYFDAGSFNYLTATNEEILEYVQEYVDWIAPLFRTKVMPVGCSDEFYKRYKRAYKAVWGPGSDKSDQTNFGSDNIDFSKQYLRPIDGMYASPILFTTPKENLIKLRHKNDVPRVINDVQKVDYEVRLFGEYWLGAGFAYGEAVVASVPDGYDPTAQINKLYGAHTSYQQNKGIPQGSGSVGGGL